MLTCRAQGGDVTNSQLFTFNGGSGPLSFQPENDVGSCFTVKGNVLDVAQCNSGDAKQSFTFGAAAAAGGNSAGKSGKTTAVTSPSNTGAASTSASATPSSASKDTAVASKSSTTCSQRTRTVTASAVSNDRPGNQDATSATSSSQSGDTTSATEQTASATEASSSSTSSSVGETTNPASGAAIANPTTPVPVSRAGGTLNPTAAAESQQRDDTATRAFSEVEIRAPNGQCLFVDPTAGDFRQNLIPIALVDCAGTPNEKWDVITAGKHNNAQNSALIVSSLVCALNNQSRATH